MKRQISELKTYLSRKEKSRTAATASYAYARRIKLAEYFLTFL
ncbi:MAG: hypothetical protein QM426_07910 [Euryarchaeota archaeon]|nr:hypothetical protein [Euryarchaeota archaeon]